MVSTNNKDAHPQSHPIPDSQPNSCTEDFEASDEEAGCASDDDNFMDVGENSDTEVTYVREGVAAVVAKNERIMGRLSLIKQNRVMFLAWLPYSPGSLLPDGTFHTPPIVAAQPTARDCTMYAVHPIPLSEVKAVRKHAPSFGTQHIVLVLTNGLTLPPLYFTAGGVRALFSALKEHCDLVKSAEDPNTYLINDTADPLQQSLSGLLLDGLPPSASAAFAPRTDWYYSLPPVIRLYGTACVATTAAVTLGLINPMSLLLHWPSVFKGQIFRLVASFIFLGKPSINFLMKMLWMIQYGVPLEKSTYQFSTADFAYMLFVGMVSLLGASVVVPVQLLGPSLIFMMVYVWSRNFASSNISLMGLVSIQAFYLPFALLALDLAMGGDWMSDLLGIIVGHLYYFLKELHPAAGGGRLLETPMWLKRALLSAGIGTVQAREVPMQHPSDARFRAFAGRGRRLDD